MRKQPIENDLTYEQLAERKELFRHTDLDHPLMQCLFNIPPSNLTTEQN